MIRRRMGSHFTVNFAFALMVLGLSIAIVDPPAFHVVNGFSPLQYGPAVSLVGSQSCPAGIAVDSAETLYWVNYCSDQLLEFPKGASFPTDILSGLNGPDGVGVDAAGNVYYDEYPAGTLSRLAPNSSTPQVLLTGLDHPNFMSVDAAGDVYFIIGGMGMDMGQACGDKIVRFDVISHNVTTLLVAPQPHDSNHGFGGLFADQSGDLYYTTCDYLTLDLLPSGSSTPSVILNTISRPTGIAVDKIGNVYYALYNSSVNELPLHSKIPLILTSQGSSRLQLTIDEAGDLYYTDNIGGRIWMIPLGSSNQAATANTTTITSTMIITSVLPSTITSVSFNTQTVSVAPSTRTLTSVSVSTQLVSVAPPTITRTSISFNTQTTTETYTSPYYASPFSPPLTIGLLLALSLLAVYVVWSSRKRNIPSAPQPPVDQIARETVDGIVLKYVSDHSGKISISIACTDLGIAEPQLRDSLARLIDKGLLNK